MNEREHKLAAVIEELRSEVRRLRVAGAPDAGRFIEEVSKSKSKFGTEARRLLREEP